MPNLTKPQDSQLKPSMLSLVKQADATLGKYGLTGHTAAVALILDYSGSMGNLYLLGQVQRLVERFVALGHRFDDDGQIDLYAYHNDAEYIGTLSAVDCADVYGRIRDKMGSMGGTDYAAGMACFREKTFGSCSTRSSPFKGVRKGGFMGFGGKVEEVKTPSYVGFITDGQNGGSNADCVDQFRSSSFEPAFIQCIALGEDYNPKTDSQPPHEFKFLAKLDSNVSGRLVDNTGFFATVTPDALSDAQFMDRMMGEYPDWLKLAKTEGLLA